MNMNWMQTRRTRYTAYVTVYILVIVAVVALANYLSTDYYKTIDLTSNQRYSLSDQTAKIVKGLKQTATITYIDQETGFKRAKDLLGQYKNLSSKVKVEYVEMDKNPKAARAAAIAAGLKELRYGTALVQIGTRDEEAKSLDETGITGAIVRDLKGKVRNVCFMAGAGETQIDDTTRYGYSVFKEVIEKDNYQTKTVNWLEKGEIPNDCTVLVVGGPVKDYVQVEVDAVKKYVEGGGRALFLLQPPLKGGRNSIADNDALTSLIQSWGVTLEKDIILDRIGQQNGLGPEAAVILKSGYGSHAIVNEMKRIESVLERSRSIEVKNTDKTTVEKLFSTSPATLAVMNLSAPDLQDPNNKRGPFTIGAAGEYKTGKENAPGRFVVVGSSDWVSNGNIYSVGNADLAVNSINWLASDEDMISIRPKAEDDRRVMLGGGEMKMVIWVSQALLPLSVVVCGILVWVRRSRSGR